LISPSISTAILPEFATYDTSSRSSSSSDQTHGAPDSDRTSTQRGRAIPAHVALERRGSNSSSAAEEGEATPLLGDETFTGKWYEGPMFTAGIKLAMLFFVFTAIVAGTFYFGMPKLDP